MKITSSTIEIEVMWTDENDFSKPGHFISREQNDRNRLSMELLNQLFSNEDLGIDIMFPVTFGTKYKVTVSLEKIVEQTEHQVKGLG